MSMAKIEYLLDFYIINKSAKAHGWRVVYRKDFHDKHLKKYGNFRPFLKDENFINKELVNIIKFPTEIRKSILKEEKTGKIKIRPAYLFYKKKKNKYFLQNKNEKITEYYKVAVWCKPGKILEITSIVETPSISHKQYTKPLKRI